MLITKPLILGLCLLAGGSLLVGSAQAILRFPSHDFFSEMEKKVAVIGMASACPVRQERIEAAYDQAVLRVREWFSSARASAVGEQSSRRANSITPEAERLFLDNLYESMKASYEVQVGMLTRPRSRKLPCTQVVKAFDRAYRDQP